MNKISIDPKNITPEMKEKLLANHQVVIEILTIVALLIKNPILRFIVESIIKLIDSICDMILTHPEDEQDN